MQPRICQKSQQSFILCQIQSQFTYNKITTIVKSCGFLISPKFIMTNRHSIKQTYVQSELISIKIDIYDSQQNKIQKYHVINLTVNLKEDMAILMLDREVNIIGMGVQKIQIINQEEYNNFLKHSLYHNYCEKTYLSFLSCFIISSKSIFPYYSVNQIVPTIILGSQLMFYIKNSIQLSYGSSGSIIISKIRNKYKIIGMLWGAQHNNYFYSAVLFNENNIRWIQSKIIQMTYQMYSEDFMMDEQTNQVDLFQQNRNNQNIIEQQMISNYM